MKTAVDKFHLNGHTALICSRIQTGTIKLLINVLIMRLIIDCLKAPFICKARSTKLVKLDQDK